MKEQWRDVEGYEGYYQVSNFGRVESLGRDVINKWGTTTWKPERILKGSVQSLGYCVVYFCVDSDEKVMRVHRLVAEAFIPNPENKPHENHLDGDKQNNRVSNLEWCTPAENTAHAIENGLHNTGRGERHGHAKLTWKDIRIIRRLRRNGMALKNIASRFNVSESNISYIANGHTWDAALRKARGDVDD